MYYGSTVQRREAVDAFMLKKDSNGVLIHKDQPDTLIGLGSILGIGTNWQRETIDPISKGWSDIERLRSQDLRSRPSYSHWCPLGSLGILKAPC